jgi:LPXTG-motif cell wall-anchored protein
VDEEVDSAWYYREPSENSEYLPKAGSTDEEKTTQQFTNIERSPVALPSTGGMGTGVIYGAGAALLLLAVLALILLNRKRTDGEGIR